MAVSLIDLNIIDMVKTNLIEEHSESDNDQSACPPAPTHNEMLNICDKIYRLNKILKNISRLQAHKKHLQLPINVTLENKHMSLTFLCKCCVNTVIFHNHIYT